MASRSASLYCISLILNVISLSLMKGLVSLYTKLGKKVYYAKISY
jgi:hypothetical protein